MSSDHSFPFRLADPKLRFNLDNLNCYIYAGEIPPFEMYKLLTEKWDMEHRLAVALIDCFGGHIYDVYRALICLQMDMEDFDLVDSDLQDKVRRCLQWQGEKKDDPIRMRESLRQLARTGFFPLENVDDPLAKVLSENNVGGVVRRSAKIIGLRREVWQEADNGIVPVKQSMRLTIANVLENMGSQ